MKPVLYTILITSLFICLACQHRHQEMVVADVEVVNINEGNSIEWEPPPPNINCADSLSLKDLFLMLSNKATPVSADSAAKYHFILYRTKGCMVVRFLIDKEYTSKDTSSANLAEKRKSYPFYPLCKAGYFNLDWKPMFTKIRAELKAVSQTPAFQSSNLAKAKSVTIQLNDRGEVVLK